MVLRMPCSPQACEKNSGGTAFSLHERRKQKRREDFVPKAIIKKSKHRHPLLQQGLVVQDSLYGLIDQLLDNLLDFDSVRKLGFLPTNVCQRESDNINGDAQW